MAGKFLDFKVLKRTFEGRVDKTKNDNALTSEYMPSKKYIAFYNVQWEHGGISEIKECYTSKKEAIEDMELKKQYGI